MRHFFLHLHRKWIRRIDDKRECEHRLKRERQLSHSWGAATEQLSVVHHEAESSEFLMMNFFSSRRGGGELQQKINSKAADQWFGCVVEGGVGRGKNIGVERWRRGLGLAHVCVCGALCPQPSHPSVSVWVISLSRFRGRWPLSNCILPVVTSTGSGYLLFRHQCLINEPVWHAVFRKLIASHWHNVG